MIGETGQAVHRQPEQLAESVFGFPGITGVPVDFNAGLFKTRPADQAGDETGTLPAVSESLHHFPADDPVNPGFQLDINSGKGFQQTPEEPGVNFAGK